MDNLGRFVSDFVQQMTEEDAGMIEYIVLSGSAARGDFRTGTSDIDLIIKTTDAAHIRPVFTKADKTFWQLDEKYRMNQRELFDNKKDAMLIPLGRGQKYAVSVFSRLPEKSVRAYFDLFHKEMMRARLRPHMKVLYGKKWGRVVYDDPLSLLMTYSLAVSLLAVPVFLFAPERAFKSSVRSVLFTMDMHLSGNGWKGRAAEEARNARVSDAPRPYMQKAAYCLKAPFIILANNVSELMVKTRTGRLPEELINENKNLR